MNDIIVNKIQSIQRCVKRAREEYKAAGKNFREDDTRQDAAILNVVRACEQAIDLANHIIRMLKAGIPNESKEAFSRIAEGGVITPELSGKLEKMTGFRNIIVHSYQDTDINIVISVIEKDMSDLIEFTEAVKTYYFGKNSD